MIKIDPPTGDLTRSTPPHRVGDTSLYFVTNNRNKRGVVLDLKVQAAREAFYALCRVADVVILVGDNYLGRSTTTILAG